jgi:hypothetical protein
MYRVQVQLRDFQRYLRATEGLEGFLHDKAAIEQHGRTLTLTELESSRGQGLVQAMQEVPAIFFDEGFDLDSQELWNYLGDVHAEESRQVTLDTLSNFLVRG